MSGDDSISARLRTLRTGRGDDQADVAEAVGISRTHLSNLERGHDEPGRETIMALAAYYNVSLDWLVTGDGEQTPSAAAAANEHEALWLYAYRQLPPDEATSMLKLLLARIRPAGN